MALSGAPDFARGAQTEKFNQNLMVLFLWISVMHSQQCNIRADLLVVLFQSPNSLVLDWDFLSVFCCWISWWLRLPQGPASSPAVHLTCRALPGLKLERVCFLLSVCWSQSGEVRDWNLCQTTTNTLQPPIKSYTHCHPPADSVRPPPRPFSLHLFL